MSTEAPSGDDTRRRWPLALLLLLLLLLISSCTAFVLGERRGQTSADDAATPGPTPTITVTAPARPALPAPRPTVTETVTAPAPGSGTGEGAGAGSGSAGGSGEGSGGGSTGGGTTDGSGSGSVDAGQLRAFTMTAQLLNPPLPIGVARTVRITVSNPNSVPIVITRVSAAVSTPAPGCNVAWFEVGDYSATATTGARIPANGSGNVALSLELINLANTNQDACQGATLRLELDGSATSTS